MKKKLSAKKSGYKNNGQSNLSYNQLLDFVQKHSAYWQELCTRYLPIVINSEWRQSREDEFDDPEQGWKLHIAATVFTANDVLEKIAPLLISRGIQFKAPISLDVLMKLNSGLDYGYSQVGKFMTVYPKTTEEAVVLARLLHKLTYGIAAPSVPFDLRYKPDSSVFYRYGAFKSIEIENPNGTITLAIKDLKGKLVPDVRERPKPDWVIDPFQSKDTSEKQEKNNSDNPLKTTYRVFRALTQHGRGGVYQAIDLSVNPPRLCVVKEGRKHGEVAWDGRDGYWRVQHEERILAALRDTNVNAPEVYSAFILEKNYYLVMECIEGRSLGDLIKLRRRRLPLKQILKYGVLISNLVFQIHSEGWVWRDCKPANIVVTKSGSLRPLDFEGACSINEPDILLWGTPEFSPPEWNKPFVGQSRKPEDLYAIGAVIYFLLTGKIYQADSPIAVKKLRRDVPHSAQEIIAKLLARKPEERPSAQIAAREFSKALKFLS